MFADGRENLSAYPVLELFGLRLVGSHDYLVEVLFVNKNKLLDNLCPVLVICWGIG